MGKFKVIGLTGGIGSGKSTVAAMFGRLGAIVVDADEICHRLLFDGGIKARVRKAFGDAVFNADGEVDRMALGRAVFKNAAKLKGLTKILHPPVHEEIRGVVRAARKEGVAPAAVLDVVLLLESNMEKMCDVLVFVNASPEVRAARIRKDRDWSRGEIERREKFQMPINKKIKMADYVINNSLTRRDTFDQVRHIWRELCHEEE
jgi:dephospho-CoA kinase